MKSLHIIIILLVSFIFSSQAQNQNLIIKPNILEYITTNSPDLRRILLQNNYKESNDSTLINIQSRQLERNISKVTFHKKSNTITLEENIAGATELLEHLAKNHYYVKQLDQKKYELAKTSYNQQISTFILQFQKDKFTLLVYSPSKQSSFKTEGFSAFNISSPIYQKVKMLAAQETEKSINNKREIAKNNEEIRRKSFYLTLPFNLEKLCDYFGYTTKSLYDQLLYTDQYNDIGQTEETNTLQNLYFSYLKIQHSKYYREVSFKKRNNNNQSIYTLYDPKNQLVGIRYNILSQSTQGYLSEWKALGAAKITSNDQVEIYEYKYKSKSNYNYKNITLNILVEKKTITKLETRVNVLLMKVETFRNDK